MISEQILSNDHNQKLTNENKQKKVCNGQLVSHSSLDIGRYELHWVKLRGFSMWPAIVEEVVGVNRFIVHFFGDYTRSTVFRSCILSIFKILFKKSKCVRPWIYDMT